MYLQAGSFHILYEKGFLRQIKQDTTEVVRMIYFALRDHNWGTFDREIENEVIDNQGGHFLISYDCFNVNEANEPIFAWKVKIEGEKDGRITFEIQGEALEAVRKNRAGFCILHPIKGVAEQPVTIFHADNSNTNTYFPRYIAAEDPFLNIRTMRWRAAHGVSYQLDFEGDIFQTEDQRNWGDASYKTFCTPLSLLFPVQLQKGDTVWQRVTLHPPLTSTPTQRPENKKSDDVASKAISLGIAASVETKMLSDKAITLLKSLNLNHYRIDINPSSTNWITDFSTDCENAAALNLPLEIALSLENHYEEKLADFVGVCQQNKLEISSLFLFSSQTLATPQALINLIPSLKLQLPKVKIGVGTNYNFTELNRNRFDVGEADFITFSYHPQVHAFDDLSLMENTETLLYQVESAEKLYQKPVHVSFISLRKRANPYATNSVDFIVPVEKQADSRQKTEFGAAWTRQVLAYLSQTNAVSVTIFRTVGELGLMTPDAATYPVFESLRSRR